MDRIFSKKTESEENGEHWLSVSDLMAGLMMVFLFISLVFMMITKTEEEKIKEIATAYQQNQISIYKSLKDEFEDDLAQWGASIDKNTLAINFKSPDVLFANNQATLSDTYKDILDDFFPRYINVLKPFRASLEEIRIEGHTSSIWQRNSSKDEAYFFNMRLSQSRTRAVLEYCHDLMPFEADWIKSNIAAVGFSSSRPVLVNGKEDPAKSRRVSFRAITNAEQQIKRILNRTPTV